MVHIDSVIQQLLQIQSEYGNLPVKIYDNATDVCGNFDGVEYNDDDNVSVALITFYSDEE